MTPPSARLASPPAQTTAWHGGRPSACSTLGSALDVARKLRAAIAKPQLTAEGKSVEMTASLGLCGLDRVPAGERRLAERVVKIADAALYRSKKAGRNRVTATMLNAPGD